MVLPRITKIEISLSVSITHSSDRDADKKMNIFVFRERTSDLANTPFAKYTRAVSDPFANYSRMADSPDLTAPLELQLPSSSSVLVNSQINIQGRRQLARRAVHMADGQGEGGHTFS